jgi:transposase-like protein
MITPGPGVRIWLAAPREVTHERGIMVDHTMIFRWVQRYAPEIEKRVRWYQGYRSASWRLDEVCRSKRRKRWG